MLVVAALAELRITGDTSTQSTQTRARYQSMIIESNRVCVVMLSNVVSGDDCVLVVVVGCKAGRPLDDSDGKTDENLPGKRT
jgi:hypothetical protein